MAQLFIGIALALIIIFSVKNKAYARLMYSASLISLPLIYAGFGLFSSNVNTVFSSELLVGLPYILAGIAISRHLTPSSILLVGLLWLGHGIYDVYHDILFINNGVPFWYPLMCAGVDISFGFYLLFLGKNLPTTNCKAA